MIPTGDVVELLQALIRNACVNDGHPDSGHEHRSVATLRDYLGHAGTIVEPHPGRQNVIYRLPGTEPDAPALALVPHLDVVPADASTWSHDPFAGDIVDGEVWGRGAVDMLNVTAAMAAVFKRHLAEERPRLPGDLLFIATADEEAGSRFGAAHLVEHHWESVRCDYLLTEVANPSFVTPSGSVLPVTVAEKGPAWRRLAAHGVAGHGSQPYGTRNALVPLADAVARLAAEPTPVVITAEWRAFVAGLGLEPSLEARLVDADAVDGAIEDLAAADPLFARWVHACTHLTVTPTTFHSGTKANVVPAVAEGDVDVRKLPGQDEVDVDDYFRKVLGPDLESIVDIEPLLTFPANASAASGPLWDAIGEAAAAISGRDALVPAMTPVATDARFFRARGVVAYGVGLFDEEATFGSMLSMFHGDDERVSIRSLDLTTRLLDATIGAFGLLTDRTDG